jgi:signal transduction histidine kinase
MFKKARLKLTAWYLVIIMTISLFFSFVIYNVLSNEVERFAKIQKNQIEYRFHYFNNSPPPPFLTDPDLIIEVKQRIFLRLAEINLLILVIAGTLGYFLAGKTLDPIAKMMEEQNRFISDASHELRTPLTALKTSLEVNLRDQNLTVSSAKNIIRHNIEQVNKLQMLTDNLLELAQHKNSNNKKYFQIVSIKKIIDEVVKKMIPLAQKKQITIKKKLLEAHIKGNPESLNNLFTILLDNAIKYSPDKSQVVISAQKNEKSVTLFFEDNGFGISQKDLPHIFDRFYRADQARSKDQTEGYGLGLAIAKKIVEDHQGLIKVKSKLNQGTTFQIVFSINK